MDPARGKERIEELDILRGWAIFGMLFVNVLITQVIDLPPLSFMLQQVWTPIDKVAYMLIDSFGQAKFWSLFSFLFGLGFALQMKRAEVRGVNFCAFYLRRLLGLFLIGSVQYLIGPPISILPTYAIVGFFLLPFRNRSPKLILVTALVCFLIPNALELWDAELHQADPHAAQELSQENVERDARREARREETLRVYSEGTLKDLISYNANRYMNEYASLGIFRLLSEEFPLLLLGLYVGRLRVFENIPAHLPFIRTVLWWGLGLGVLNLFVNAVAMLTPSLPYLVEIAAYFVWRVGAPALGFFYASTIVLLAQRETWKRRLTPMAAVGRMALSNYLLHTLVLQCIFHHFGLGLFGKIGPAAGLAVAGLVYTLLVVLSLWWLRRFQFGPAEWVWRTITYGKLQPMRVHGGLNS